MIETTGCFRARLRKHASPLRPWLVLVALTALPAAASEAQATGPTYVGRETCVPCHTREAVQYKGSHHDRAMQPADASTVLGDFNDATFTYHGVTSTFFKKDGTFYVRTDGPDGQLHDYRIAYTFGVDPLQQYLIAFPDGRTAGAERLLGHAPERAGRPALVPPVSRRERHADDILHWTGPYQNWNHMCAECHSTNVRKNYTADRRTAFDTTWSEIDVSCEACHGPGSRHVAWAEAAEAKASGTADPRKGLVVGLRERPRRVGDRGSRARHRHTRPAARHTSRSRRAAAATRAAGS